MKSTNSYIVSAKRSGTYVMSTEPSDLSVYTSSYLTEFERRIFIDNLTIKSIEFSAAENAQIFCRCLIHESSKPNDSYMLKSGIKVGSETILCLHGFERLTTSWTWIKFAATLFRQGFNVIMMDSPGFGKSSIARDVRSPLSSWKSWDAQLVMMFLSKLSISKVNVMACYEGASTFVNLLLSSSHVLGKNHYIHNPVFKPEELSESTSLSMIKALLTTGQKRRIFTTFDRTKYPDPRDSTAASLSDEEIQALVVAERFMRQVSKSVGFNPIVIAPVTGSDLTEVLLHSAGSQPGTRPVLCLYPSKSLRIYVVQFLTGVALEPYAAYLPEDVSGDKSLKIANNPEKPESRVSELPFTYGVRIRQMEDEIVMDLVTKRSEQEFLAEYGEDKLLHQQALSAGLRNVSTEKETQAPILARAKDLLQNPKYIGRLVLQQREIEGGNREVKPGLLSNLALPPYPSNASHE